MKLNNNMIEVVKALKIIYECVPATYQRNVKRVMQHVKLEELRIEHLIWYGSRMLMPGSKWYYNENQLNWRGTTGVEKVALKCKELSEYFSLYTTIKNNYVLNESSILEFGDNLVLTFDDNDGELYIDERYDGDGKNYRILIEFTEPYFSDHLDLLKSIANLKIALPVETAKLKAFLEKANIKEDVYNG